MALNDRGIVVGECYGEEQSPQRTSAFVWSRDEGMKTLQPLAGFRNCSVTDVNNNGQVIGYSFDRYGTRRACMWDRVASSKIVPKPIRCLI